MKPPRPRWLSTEYRTMLMAPLLQFGFLSSLITHSNSRVNSPQQKTLTVEAPSLFMAD